MDTGIQTLHLRDKQVYNEWRAFLESLGITGFADQEIQHIETTLGIYDDAGKLVATGSVTRNVLKYIAASNADATAGSRFNTIISALMAERAQNGVFHLFVYTKPQHVASFEYIGFNLLAQTEMGALLETGDQSITDYLQAIPKVPVDQRIAGIVMNANPFTYGHRYLVEQAAKANDYVYVFVVSNDVSLFSTDARTQLVKAGLSDLSNVIVVSGGDYMVSFATFPSYFIKSDDDAIRYQTSLDAQLFKTWIGPALNISRRYLGSEPLSRTTNIYNQSLQRILPPEIAVEVVARKTSGDKVITATEVRRAIAADDLSTIQKLVPVTTYDYLQSHLSDLQAKIKEGTNINGN